MTRKGHKKTQNIKIWKCSTCNKEIICMHRTQDANCYECRIKQQKAYRNERGALKVLTDYQ